MYKHKSFIFNGNHSRNLILIPTNFKNKESYVNSQNILKTNSNETESQLYLDNKSIKLIHDYFKSIKLDHEYYLLNDDKYKLPMSETFLLGDDSANNIKTTVKINIIKQTEFSRRLF